MLCVSLAVSANFPDNPRTYISLCIGEIVKGLSLILFLFLNLSVNSGHFNVTTANYYTAFVTITALQKLVFIYMKLE